MAILVVFFGLDPVRTLLFPYPTLFFPQRFFQLLIRMGLLIWFAFELGKAVCAILIVGLMVVIMSNEGTKRFKEIVQRRPILIQVRVMGAYRQMQVWNQYVNQNFSRFAVPPLIFFGIII